MNVNAFIAARGNSKYLKRFRSTHLSTLQSFALICLLPAVALENMVNVLSKLLDEI
jgi:hypothetical protein